MNLKSICCWVQDSVWWEEEVKTVRIPPEMNGKGGGEALGGSWKQSGAGYPHETVPALGRS